MGATVTFDGATVTIERAGFLERFTVGKGRKSIPLTAISAVQWKQPGVIVNGFLQFTIGGGNEARSRFGRQTMDAASDENSVVFDARRTDEFAAIRDAVQAALAAKSAPAAPPMAAKADVVDQIRRFGELRDAGMVSAAEFDAFKARLLAQM